MIIPIWFILASFKCLLSPTVCILRFRILKRCSFPGWNFNIHAPDLPTGFSGSNVKCSGGRPGPPSSAPPFPPSPVRALFLGLPSLCRVHSRSSQFSSVQAPTSGRAAGQYRTTAPGLPAHLSFSYSCSLRMSHESEWRKQTLRPALALWLQRSARAES